MNGSLVGSDSANGKPHTLPSDGSGVLAIGSIGPGDPFSGGLNLRAAVAEVRPVATDDEGVEPMRVVDASAIIAGTAIGGGFLALPHVTSPLGYLPGTPVSPNGKVGIDMEEMMNGNMVRLLPEDRYKTFAQMPTKEDYTSEARDQGAAGIVKPKLYSEGIIPGYGGHKKEAKFSYGHTIYTNGIPKGGGKHDNWSGKNFASTGHGASSMANFEDDVGLNTSGDVPVTSAGSV